MRKVVGLIVVGLIIASGLVPAGAAPDAYNGVVLEEGWITDRYGDDLKAFFTWPASDGVKVTGPFPVILTLQYPNPVQHDAQRIRGVDVNSDEAGFARKGYVQVDVNWNGTAPSDGWDAFFTTRMQLSGYDVVEWLAGFKPDGTPSPAAEWSTGRVGMFGGSGMGVSQILVAQHNPPHLVAIAPVVATSNAYEDFAYRGGIRNSVEATIVAGLYASTQAHCTSVPNDPGEAEAISACLRKRAERGQVVPAPVPAEWFSHPTQDPYWEPFNAKVPNIHAAIWSLGSWDDHFLRGNMTLWNEGTSPRMLTVGWGGHDVGAGFDHVEEQTPWFDYWLKGETENGIAVDLARRPVRYFTIQEKAWHEAADWPIPGTEFTDLYLEGAPPVVGATGSLSTTVPAQTDAADTYVYDPAQGRHNGSVGLVCRQPTVVPVDPRDGSLGGANSPNCPADQRLEAVDSLSYLGGALDQDTEVTGPISMTLYAASSATDTDWIIKLVDVFPDGSTFTPEAPQPGYWNLVTSGRLKGTHRNGHVVEEPIPVGQVVRYDVEFLPTSYLFRVGHRIAIQIASADASRTWPNPNPAMNTVSRSTSYPSHITLPFIP